MRNRIMEGRQDADACIADGRKIGFLCQVTGCEKLDAGLLETILIIGLDETERGRPGRQEGKDRLRTGIA